MMWRFGFFRSAVLVAPLAIVFGLGCKPKYQAFPAERARCTVTMSLPNMACGTACPIKVHQAIAAVRGVEDVEVVYEERMATIHGVYPACGHDGFEDMLDNLAARGYKARIMSSR
jgi:copper chaperone CopZ